jgi:hexosaminidase
MKTSDYVEYMVLPRLLALSEVVWSPAHSRDWDGFTKRLPAHLADLQSQGYNFRIPDVLGLEHDRFAAGDSVPVELSAPLSEGEILYTLDGSDPDHTSPRYAGPFGLAAEEGGVMVSARVLRTDGSMGAVRRARFSRADPATPETLPFSRRVRGLASDDSSGRRVLSGFVRVPRSGVYTFSMTPADGGGELTIAGRVVVDPTVRRSTSRGEGQVALQRGWHKIEVRHRRIEGLAGPELEITGPRLSRRRVPPGWLAHRVSEEDREPAG